MARRVFVQQLSVGRCFTPAPDEGGPSEVTEGFRVGRSVMAPAQAWKIVGVGADGVDAVSAAGEERRFEVGALVVEIPRQGFDRLEARAQEA